MTLLLLLRLGKRRVGIIVSYGIILKFVSIIVKYVLLAVGLIIVVYVVSVVTVGRVDGYKLRFDHFDRV